MEMRENVKCMQQYIWSGFMCDMNESCVIT